ncbi:MAG: hypothetical protein NT029_08780 [Armatimonadetes bacterium]|nr:hypothetical protein [Armatimonadota bacterium]
MRERRSPNPKRRLRPRPGTDEQVQRPAGLAERASYGGNPEHKRNPGDFGLDPPSRPRPGKTLCDGAGILRRAEALRWLREGMRRGLVSLQEHNGWPQNVWAVTEDGHALEAQLENEATGAYHGYPMQLTDPLRTEVLNRWKVE